MLTNRLIKLSPPCIRKNVGFFPRKASQGAGAWESCVRSWRARRGQGDRQLSVSRGHAVTPGSPWAARAAPNTNPPAWLRRYSPTLAHTGLCPCPPNHCPGTSSALLLSAPKPPLWAGQGLCSPPMWHSEKDVFPPENLHQHSTFALTPITSKPPALQASIRSIGVRAGS